MRTPLWQALWRGHGWLAVYFDWDATAWQLLPRWQIPKGLTNVRAQYAWARWRFPGDAVLFQVGACYELYDRRDAPIAGMLGLKPLSKNRRGVLFGVPELLFGRTLARLLERGLSVVVVRQGEHDWTGIRERAVAWRVGPATG